LLSKHANIYINTCDCVDWWENGG